MILKRASKTVHELQKSYGKRSLSSRFLSRFDQLRILHKSNHGLPIDGNKKRLSAKNSDEHLCLIAPTGSGKTSGFCIPSIFTLAREPCSIIATDPSAELFNLTSGYMAQQGFKIRTLNLDQPHLSSQYNPLELADSFAEIDKLANIIIRSNTPVAKGDDIWYSAPAALLSVFIRCLKKTNHHEWNNLANVLHLISNWDCAPENNQSVIRNFVATYAKDDPSISNQFKGFLASNPRMLSSFITMAADSLKLLNNPAIASMTARNEFDFEDLREHRTMVYLIVPETDAKLYQFILNAFYTQLFDAQKRLEYKTEGNRIYAILDEFGHARLPDMATLCTSLRKYRVSMSIILQSVAQLEEQYGRNDAKTIMSGGMNSKLFLSGLDLDTSIMVEKMLGMKRTEFRKGDPDSGLRSQPLMPADRIRRLYDHEAIFLHSNQEPIQLSMTPFYKHRKFRHLAVIPPVVSDPVNTAPVTYLPLT